MTNIAFWQKGPEDNPKFMCIEAWEGIPDYDNTSHDIMTKSGMQIIKEKQKIIKKFTIEYKEI